MTNKRGSAGGRAWAVIQREDALKEYYLNPNLCLKCQKIIDVPDNRRVCEIKKYKFCSKSCAAQYNNVHFPKRTKIEKPKQITKTEILDDTTKGDIFKNRTSWQSARSAISKRARKIFYNQTDNLSCSNCGYNKHIEVCHIKDVSSFSNETLISEINKFENLISLCPNCHWEFDNDILDLNEILRK